MPPRVSVVLPVFNAAATVQRAIASVRAQTFTDWELLVVDDGSNDGTGEAVAAVAREDDRIIVLTRPHEGLVAALNAGLATARGDLIARMDADDECHVERLAEQVALLDRQNGIGLAGCLVEFGGDRAAAAGYALHVDWTNSVVTSEDIALNRFIESPFAHPSVMFHHELVERFGGYRAGDFPEDYELWLRWLNAGVRMAKVPRALLTWHDSPQRLSRTDRRYDSEAFFRMKSDWIARWLKANLGTASGKRGEYSPNAPGCDVKLGRDIWVWGAGRPTRKRAACLTRHGIRFAGYIDVDTKKTGRSIDGVPVVGTADISPPARSFVLGYVSSRGARELIRRELRAHGYIEARDFLMCA